MRAAVFVEQEAGQVKEASLHAISAARALGAPVDLILCGSAANAAAQQVRKVDGIARIRVAEGETASLLLAENAAALLEGIAADYTHILAAATSVGKNILPRLAALLDVQQISEVVAIESPERFVRPIYAGNALATVESSDRIKILSVRMTAFEAVSLEGNGEAAIEALSPPTLSPLSGFIGEQLSRSERPDLTSARIVVSGGRGMGSGENFKLLEELADKLGAAVGASRAAVDAGFVPNDYQVGQTGKIVAPDLYIAVGISGAIQHLAGMKDSKVIVAINKDEEAPIFQIADYGLVGDLFMLVPELTAALK
ncbi:MAG TPA: FAD-binding protein [Dongiaceae bacterium]|jgi:electron transfer flavoprotein alpha subunit|nr:FAD-binding protein [Dongiaceae bacterium]